MGPMTLPEIPPYRGGSSTHQPPPQMQSLTRLVDETFSSSSSSSSSSLATSSFVTASSTVPVSAAGPASSKPPAFTSKAQPPETTNPTSFPTPAPANPNGELDALNDVLFPALEEALKRRQIRLQQVYRPQVAPGQVTPRQQRAEAAHEKLRKLVYKLAHVCKEIDHYDKAEPVGMGRDVGTFLEGLLEEILVRVEPLDEEEMAA